MRDDLMLKKGNYSSWSPLMKIYLQQEKVGGHVAGTAEAPLIPMQTADNHEIVEAAEKRFLVWEAREAKAKALILTHVEKWQRREFLKDGDAGEQKTAAQMWQHLKDEHAKTTATDRAIATSEFEKFRQQKNDTRETMEERFMNLREAVFDAGGTVDDEEAAI